MQLTEKLPVQLTEKERALVLSLCRNDLRLSAVANDLHYHRNTLKYQVDRLAEKTGYDCLTFYGALNLLLLGVIWEDENKCLTQQQLNQK